MAEKIDINYQPPGVVAKEFLEDRSPFSLLMGPVGSGKTTAAIWKLMMVAMAQEPYNRHRYTRHLVTRPTYPELRSTTIKTFLEWFPEGPVTTMNWGGLITAKVTLWLPDKTCVDAEILFISLDRPEDVSKIRGMELTTAWANELSETSKAAWDMMTQRVGRYPPKRWGGPTWSGVFGDTNPPDDDSWIYKLFVEEKPESYRLFRQPGALLYRNGVYEPNPAAENVHNHSLGYDYWMRQVAGKSRDWCKVFLEGNWGTISSGKPVYPEYSDELHCREVKPYESLPLLLGFDYGLTPAVAVCQVSPRGQFRVLADIQSENMGIRQFARDVVKPYLAMNFPNYKIQATGDPAGNRRSDSDEKTCFMELAEAGIPAMPAMTNEFVARREAVAGYLTKLIDGEPAFLVDPKARNIRKGMNGGYCFKRMQIVGSERYRDVPDKNIYSHSHDALQYAALFTQTMQMSNDFGSKIEYPNLGVI